MSDAFIDWISATPSNPYRLKHSPGGKNHNQKTHGHRGQTFQEITPKESVAWGEKKYRKLADKASDDEHEALRSYTSAGYSGMNEHLRFGEEATRSELKNINNLRNLISRSAVPENVRVTRGASLPKETLDQLRPGDTIRDKGFVSTTFNHKIAEGRAYASRDDTVGIKYVIDVPKGTRGIYVWAQNLSGQKIFRGSESELLLQAGQQFRVKAIRPVEDYFEVVMEAING